MLRVLDSSDLDKIYGGETDGVGAILSFTDPISGMSASVGAFGSSSGEIAGGSQVAVPLGDGSPKAVGLAR